MASARQVNPIAVPSQATVAVEPITQDQLAEIVALRQQIEDLEKRLFDRFARSVSHLLRALENFQAIGIEFVSLTEGVDTSTPAGKMVFTVLGAVVELERSLIVERVKAGLRNARAKGKTLGRPKKVVDTARIARLRASGASWRDVCAETGGFTKGTAQRALHSLSKKPCLAQKPCRSRRFKALIAGCPKIRGKLAQNHQLFVSHLPAIANCLTDSRGSGGESYMPRPLDHPPVLESPYILS